MGRVSRVFVSSAVAGAIVCGLGLAFAGGWAVGRYALPPGDLLERVERRARGLARRAVGSSEPEAPGRFEAEFESIFLRLTAVGTRVPVERPGAGGGVTSYHGEVVLLTHEGMIFASTGPEDVRRTRIVPPDNRFDAYADVAASEEYADYNHVLAWMRYNDIAFIDAPEFRGFAVSYTEFDGEGVCYRSAVALLDLPPDSPPAGEVAAAPEDWRVVYRTEPCLPLKREWRALEGHMAGGRMAFAAPTTLYFGSGDYHWDGVYGSEILAQSPDNDYGKVIAINLAEGTARQVTLGNRNMQGIAVDRRGDVWVVEHGPRGGDELNRVVEGTNYGWPLETLGTSYNRTPWPVADSFGRHDRFRPPTFAWLPSVAISALTGIEGFHDAWDGDLLMGSLQDRSLHRIRIEDHRVLFAERIPVGERLRYVHQHDDGRIVLWTDSGFLIFIGVSDNTFVAEFIESYLADLESENGLRERVAAAIGACQQCHAFEPGVDAGAPSLAGIVGAEIASANFHYSDALRRISGNWTPQALAEYITDPQGFAPGTVMPSAAGVDDPRVVEEIIALLEAIAKTAE